MWQFFFSPPLYFSVPELKRAGQCRTFALLPLAVDLLPYRLLRWVWLASTGANSAACSLSTRPSMTPPATLHRVPPFERPGHSRLHCDLRFLTFRLCRQGTS